MHNQPFAALQLLDSVEVIAVVIGAIKTDFANDGVDAIFLEERRNLGIFKTARTFDTGF